MALDFDRDLYGRPPMGRYGQGLLQAPPPGPWGGGGGTFKDIAAAPAGGGGSFLKAKPLATAAVTALPPPPPGVPGAPSAPGAPTPMATAGPGAGGRPAGGVRRPKKGGVLTGDRLVADTLERTLRGELTSFGPNVMEQSVSSALAARDSDKTSGLDAVNREIAARGLGRSPMGAAAAGDVIRGAASDFSSRIGDLYSQKAQTDFSDRMGAMNPYQQYLARKQAAAMGNAQLAEQKRQFDINQANRGKGGGGGGPSDDDMLLKLLMGNEEFF